jgi:hypothetical protein
MQVIDILGKPIQVTDLEAAIKEAEMFSFWEDKNAPKKVNQVSQGYWIDLANKLKALKIEIEALPIPVKVIDPEADNLPLWVKELREARLTSYQSGLKYNTPDGFKLFVKDKKASPLYGAWSCIRTQDNFYRLDKLEIGETWERGWGSPSITRIF